MPRAGENERGFRWWSAEPFGPPEKSNNKTVCGTRPSSGFPHYPSPIPERSLPTLSHHLFTGLAIQISALVKAQRDTHLFALFSTKMPPRICPSLRLLSWNPSFTTVLVSVGFLSKPIWSAPPPALLFGRTSVTDFSGSFPSEKKTWIVLMNH